MKKKLTILIVVMFVLTLFNTCIGQSKEESLFYDLIGRSKNYIKRTYPNYYEMDHGVWNGYYHISNYTCKDGGLIAILLGFDRYKSSDEVGTLGMFIQGCSDEFPILENIYGALSVSIVVSGLDFYDLKNMHYIIEESDKIIVKLPDDIIVMVFKKINDSGIYYESSISMLNGSK